MPVAATKHTAAGARAFAKFFLQTIDWGYATTSSTYMKRYYKPSCEQCRFVRASLDNARRDKQHFVGGRVAVSHLNTTKGGTASAEYSVKATVSIGAAEVRDNKGRVTNPITGVSGYYETVGVSWDDAAWASVSLKGSKS